MAKVQIRIAVAVDSEGNWGASGWGTLEQNADVNAMSVALECLADYIEHEPLLVNRRYWLKLELEVPEVPAPQELTLTRLLLR